MKSPSTPGQFLTSLLILILLATIFMAPSAKADHPKVVATQNASGQKKMPAQATIIRFTDRTMGQIFRMPVAWNRQVEVPKGDFYSLAKGSVQMRPGNAYYFQPNMSICDHIGLLNEFPPDTLQALDVANFELSDALLTTIGNLHSLRALKLKGSDINDAGIKSLGGLPNLQYIDLAKTLVSGAGLHNLTASKDIRRIDLSWDAISPDLTQNLTNFPKLACLFLARSHVKDSDLHNIAKIKTLEHLKISSNSGITDSGIGSLATLKHLRTLELGDTKVTPKGLQALKGLPIAVLWLDSRYGDATNMAMLRKTFPHAVLHLDSRIDTNIPVEVFAPLH
jgi:hypothetical protein